MITIQQHIEERLGILVGLQLIGTRRIRDMRIFHFGPRHHQAHTITDTYALHIQCAWRIEYHQAIFTGRSDVWEPVHDPDTAIDAELWDFDTHRNLQDDQMQRLFETYDPLLHAATNTNKPLIVERVQSDPSGGLHLSLSAHYCIVLFPNGTKGEDWRFFLIGTHQPASHLVVEGGRIKL